MPELRALGMECLMGRRIRFKGAYEPYVIGAHRPSDFEPWRGVRKPKYDTLLINTKEGLTCVTCLKPIGFGGRHYITPAKAAIHEMC
jgi:hypothetical protein